MKENNQFRIKEINIRKYCSTEYCGLKSSLEGESLFVYGTNNAGKTTSFDAIISSIFGQGFIDRHQSSLDDTEIRLTNNYIETTIKRKYNKKPMLIIHERGKEIEKIEGQAEVERKLMELFNLPSEDAKLSKLIVNVLVIPQREEDTILRKFSQDQMRSIVIAFSSGVKTSEEIKKINQETDKNKKDIEKLSYQKTNILNEINYSKLVVQKNKKYLNEIKAFLSEYESGGIFEAKKALEQNQELKTNLETLTSTLTGKNDKLIKVRGKIGYQNQYHNKKLLESVKETLSVLMCPVCEDNLDVEKVEGRKSKKLCPFCGGEKHAGDLYEIIESRIKEADSEIEELKKQETEISEQIKDLENKIEELKQKNRIPYNINPIIIRVIKDCNGDEEIKTKYKEYNERYPQLEQELEEAKGKIDSNEGYRKKIDSQIEEYKNKLKELEYRKIEIEEDRNTENIKKFSKTLNSSYKELIKPEESNLIYEEGKIYLDTGISKKDCSQKGEFGYSQKKLIDVALWMTFHQFNYDNKTTNLNFGLFDDIFENIDNVDVKWKDNLISVLKMFKENIQFITFSIDEAINSQISCEVVEKLIYQSKLKDYIR
ncbi:MAG: hypothetical protein CVT88_01690 [Candidatus Altiarchaeales archaeon HGW-Altiarchaeales-1]|nr:MAG: hypothetical protein CVT88_01690 [Candidatus Altiarchaeales archaeon HGW-Altiarchaeales-1]